MTTYFGTNNEDWYLESYTIFTYILLIRPVSLRQGADIFFWEVDMKYWGQVFFFFNNTSQSNQGLLGGYKLYRKFCSIKVMKRPKNAIFHSFRTQDYTSFSSWRGIIKFFIIVNMSVTKIMPRYFWKLITPYSKKMVAPY